MPPALLNANPVVYGRAVLAERPQTEADLDEDVYEPIDAREVFGGAFVACSFSGVERSFPTVLIRLPRPPVSSPGGTPPKELIRSINDPEHPLTLEQLNVAQADHITVDDERSLVRVEFTPTIPHCSMATLIGLCVRVRLLRSLPERFKVDIAVRPGTHQSEQAGENDEFAPFVFFCACPRAANVAGGLSAIFGLLLAGISFGIANGLLAWWGRQLQDKERVAAALENKHLLEVVNQCLENA
ncbi:MAG: hypothetical protein BJ554DRAFT_5712 [Olpidium bornovanus]|uniref:MIP18 family-like domain-containing protein n=1 Tax=Olpidium bornovanus TaxID=278681 RepID=A0A8H8A1X3_9FUNG|nr:MAG: hypothetical protein BJ554DRAFT_5712 [Olpidium bornovanus]